MLPGKLANAERFSDQSYPWFNSFSNFEIELAVSCWKQLVQLMEYYLKPLIPKLCSCGLPLKPFMLRWVRWWTLFFSLTLQFHLSAITGSFLYRQSDCCCRQYANADISDFPMQVSWILVVNRLKFLQPPPVRQINGCQVFRARVNGWVMVMLGNLAYKIPYSMGSHGTLPRLSLTGSLAESGRQLI